MLSVALTKSEHRYYTNRWRSKLSYGMRHEKEKIFEAAAEIYADNEVLLNAALTTKKKKGGLSYALSVLLLH